MVQLFLFVSENFNNADLLSVYFCVFTHSCWSVKDKNSERINS